MDYVENMSSAFKFQVKNHSIIPYMQAFSSILLKKFFDWNINNNTNNVQIGKVNTVSSLNFKLISKE